MKKKEMKRILCEIADRVTYKEKAEMGQPELEIANILETNGYLDTREDESGSFFVPSFIVTERYLVDVLKNLLDNVK